MNNKILIVVIVAIAVVGTSYYTYLQDQDDTLELREYLVEGDWVTYSSNSRGYENETTYTVTEILTPLTVRTEVTTADYNYSIDITYSFLLTVIDPDDESMVFVGNETMKTFLGKIVCNVYTHEDGMGTYTYYTEPSSNLVIHRYYEPFFEEDGTFSSSLVGTSVFTPVTEGRADYMLWTKPTIGSTYTYDTEIEFTLDDGSFIYTRNIDTTTVESVNEDGTLSVSDSDTPMTVEEFLAGCTMNDGYAGAVLTGTKTFNTAWGIIDCDVYTIYGYEVQGIGAGELDICVDPDTGLVLVKYITIPDVADEDGILWDCHITIYLIDCSLILVAD